MSRADLRLGRRTLSVRHHDPRTPSLRSVGQGYVRSNVRLVVDVGRGSLHISVCFFGSPGRLLFKEPGVTDVAGQGLNACLSDHL